MLAIMANEDDMHVAFPHVEIAHHTSVGPPTGVSPMRSTLTTSPAMQHPSTRKRARKAFLPTCCGTAILQPNGDSLCVRFCVNDAIVLSPAPITAFQRCSTDLNNSLPTPSTGENGRRSPPLPFARETKLAQMLTVSRQSYYAPGRVLSRG